MTTAVYQRKKDRISKLKKVSYQKKETLMFNLWIDMIFSNLKKPE